MEKVKIGSFVDKIKKEKDLNLKKRLELVLEISRIIKKEGGRVFVIGGYPRDEIMKSLGYKIHEIKDIDLEVFGIQFDKLFYLLEALGNPDLVGANFGVIKLSGIDISLPRKDSKTGIGHKDFKITMDPEMSLKDASSRRDLTINTLMLDPLTGEVESYFDGINDIKKKILRAVDYEKFQEDPLRVLRIVQHVARFSFSIEEKTLELSKKIDLSNLSKERIGEEWVKLLTMSKSPSAGLSAMERLEVIRKIHPELQLLIDKNSWDKTQEAVDKIAREVKKANLEKEEKLVLILAALCFELKKKNIKSFLDSINISNDNISKVLKIVKEKEIIKNFGEIDDRKIRHLANRLKLVTVEMLTLFLRAIYKDEAIINDLYNKAKSLSLERRAPRPLILGKDLIEEGEKEGPRLGEILKNLFEAQLDGEFEDKSSGIEYYRKNLKNNS